MNTNKTTELTSDLLYLVADFLKKETIIDNCVAEQVVEIAQEYSALVEENRILKSHRKLN